MRETRNHLLEVSQIYIGPRLSRKSWPRVAPRCHTQRQLHQLPDHLQNLAVVTLSWSALMKDVDHLALLHHILGGQGCKGLQHELVNRDHLRHGLQNSGPELRTNSKARAFRIRSCEMQVLQLYLRSFFASSPSYIKTIYIDLSCFIPF